MPKPEMNIAHITFSEKSEDIPNLGKEKDCCDKRKLDSGFGLAGGGYGPYNYCVNCGVIVSKTVLDD